MYICFKCSSLFLSPEQLISHLAVHGILTRYECKQPRCMCSAFDTLKSFTAHLKRVHYSRVIVENVCQNNADNLEPNYAANVNNEVDALENENVNEYELLENGVRGDDLPVNLSLPEFIRTVCENAAMLSARLGSIPNINRSNASSFIDLITDFLQSGIVQALKDKVLNLLALCGNENYPDETYEISEMFNILGDPFESICTEYRRLQAAEGEGHFIRPVPYLLCHNDVYRGIAGQLVQEPSFGQFVPLRNFLKFFLEIPGMFHEIMNYVQYIESDPTVIKNFIQGSLWQEVKGKYDGKIVLPIHKHFDDYEINNCLGSHRTDDEIGALYAQIACLPPHLRSSVKNMFLVLLFLSKDRKKCGNGVAFEPAIQELKFLQEEGISLQLETGRVKVYFCLGLVIADNKANNSIHGFVECFTARFYCRVCKMHRDDCKYHSDFVPDYLIRDPINYAADVNTNDYELTGIKGNSVWNQVPYYHVTKNISCDILHDVYEGLIKYALCAILNNFVREREYFSIETLIERIDGFDLGDSEKGNRPPTSHINSDGLRDDSINLSGSEWLCLCRYLGEMIGDLVPSNNKVWDYYLIVREIVEIVTCPHYIVGTEIYLDSLIHAHHSLYISLFNKTLKAKHHVALHMSTTMRKCGPLLDLCTLTSERKHREGKAYARCTNSRVNPPLSIG